MKTVKWFLPDHGETVDDAREIKSAFTHADSVAEQIAEFYHSENGWESTWPVLFALVDDRGNEWRFSVEREMVPQFNAKAVKL